MKKFYFKKKKKLYMEKFFRAQEDHVTSSGLIIYLFVFKKISRGLKLIDSNSSKKKKKKP